MSLIGLLILLIVVSLFLWLIYGVIPMPQTARIIITVVLVVIVIVWLLGGVSGTGLHLR